MRFAICFCATAKTGLGHLRRVTNIATALKRLAPDRPLQLLTNASGEGLADAELALYQQIEQVPREQMGTHLAAKPPALVVVDTAVIPGLERVDAPLALILRETIASQLHCFALPARPWNLLLLPNPVDDWQPDASVIAAHRIYPAGWIYRPSEACTAPLPLGEPPQPGLPQLLIASGAGGGGDRWQAFNEALLRLLPVVRQRLGGRVEVIQVQGPRASAQELLAGVDRVIRPGSRLNELFAQADLVVSAMGYNSALELAACDVPVLMLAKPTTYDDQAARARRWQQRLGWAYQESEPAAAHRWVVETLQQRRRRPPVALDPGGAERAARALLALLHG